MLMDAARQKKGFGSTVISRSSGRWSGPELRASMAASLRRGREPRRAPEGRCSSTTSGPPFGPSPAPHLLRRGDEKTAAIERRRGHPADCTRTVLHRGALRESRGGFHRTARERAAPRERGQWKSPEPWP